MSPKRPLILRILADRGVAGTLAVVAVIMFAIIGPASAQFFNFGFDRRPPLPRNVPGGPPPGGGFYSPFGDPFAPPVARPQDFSRAPPAAKRDSIPEKNIVVIGDSMADWLAYGLEDAFSESPEFGVIRKHKTVSGLVSYQPRGEPSDWAAAAKQVLANEKPDVIVVMLGINDRVPLREPVKKESEKSDEKEKAAKKDTKKDPRAKSDVKADAKPADAKPNVAAVPAPAAKPDDEAAAVAKPADNDDDDDDAPAARPSAPRSANGIYQFRDERWVELYAKKIEEMIAVLKTKGVPIVWVGLPSVRGARAMSDMLFLDSLYRDGAGKAGITYVDVWDGFVDEAGRFQPQGPDFEGQIRRLRSADGVYFTKSGARKLALYTEREIRRVLASRSAPLTLPSETLSPEAGIRPGVAGPRPLAGPVVPLVASTVGTDELLGGTGTRPASVDALAARTLVKGEALSVPAGRADDFAWPRRDIAALDATDNRDAAAIAGAPLSGAAASVPPQAQKQKRPTQGPITFQSLFGTAPRPPGPPGVTLPPRPRQPGSPLLPNGAPRPPGNVGPSASAPGFFTR